MRFLVVVLLVFTQSVLAGVYKWTDEEGNVHYGDRPVNHSGAQKNTTELHVDMRTDSGISNSSENKEKRDRLSKVLEEDRKAREEKQKKYYADKNKRLKRCARLKDRLRRYRDANAVYKLDKNGERIYYSDKDRSRKENDLKKQIKKTCY